MTGTIGTIGTAETTGVAGTTGTTGTAETGIMARAEVTSTTLLTAVVGAGMIEMTGMIATVRPEAANTMPLPTAAAAAAAKMNPTVRNPPPPLGS